MENDTRNMLPTFRFAMVTIMLIVMTLMGGLLKFHADMHMLIFICIAIAAASARIIGYRWSEIEKSMISGVSRAMGALFFFFLIGMAMGAWIQSGTVPALIYYGLDILSPKFFLPAGLVISSISAVATGSSWSTAGTVGVALMGVGMGMGIPAPLIAGMIVSGAYFGDKMSPLSDTTNLSSAIAGAKLYEHMGAMLYTSAPAYICALVAYTVIGFKYSGSSVDMEQIGQIKNAIGGSFEMSLWVFVPLLLVVTLSLLRFPAIPSMAAGIASSIPIAVWIQGVPFIDALSTLNYGYSASSGVELVDTLLNRGGVQSMMWTFSLAVMALCLGGVLSKSNIMSAIIERLLLRVKDIRHLPGLTILTAIFVNATMGEQYMSIVLTGEIYKDAYPKAGFEPRMLSRALEEGGTLTSSLFPWTTGGAFMTTALGISSFHYAPYAIVNWLNPIMGITFPLLGYTLLTTERRLNKKNKVKRAVGCDIHV